MRRFIWGFDGKKFSEAEPIRLYYGERVRITLPPHDREKGLRLACQCKVLGDLVVTKYEGVWGQGGQPVDASAGRRT